MPETNDDLLTTLFGLYPETTILTDPATAHLVVEGQNLVSRQPIPGVAIKAEQRDGVLHAEITVAEGVHVVNPIHTCIGIMRPHGSQHIRLHIRLEPGATAELIAHCLFPNAEFVRHVMEAEVDIGEGAELRYSEGHYHGTFGGIEVVPQAKVHLGPNARYFSDFSLTTGRVGRLDIDYRVEAGTGAIAEITARVFGHGDDAIHIKDEMCLAGENARGLIKARVAVEDEARSEVIGITHGQAKGARGHMDCMELVRDRAVARAEPLVRVEHPLAKVTHEAAVGTVDQKQLETLMARGLTPEQAVDVIIMGMLR